MPELILSDFSGGVSKHGVHAGENTAAEISGARVAEGGLRETSSAIAASLLLKEAPPGVVLFSPERVGNYTLARYWRPASAFVSGDPPQAQSMVIVINDNGDWRPLCLRSNVPGQETYTAYNGHIYISPAKAINDPLECCVRWDGVFPTWLATSYNEDLSEGLASLGGHEYFDVWTVSTTTFVPTVGMAVFNAKKTAAGKIYWYPDRSRIRELYDIRNPANMYNQNPAVTNRGTGYTPGIYEDVPLTGGAGTGAKGTVWIRSDGTVEAVLITNVGSGYTYVNCWTGFASTGSEFAVPQSVGGTPAVISIQDRLSIWTTPMTGIAAHWGYNLAFANADPIGLPKYAGSHYVQQIVATGKRVISVALDSTTKGTGYNGGDPGTFYRVELADPAAGGQLAYIDVVLGESGVVQSVRYLPELSGYGYATAPTTFKEATGKDADGVTMAAGGGTSCTLACTIADGVVATILDFFGRGSNYNNASSHAGKTITQPGVSLTGGNGTGAVATVTTLNGVVQSLTVSSSGTGSGYTAGPTGIAQIDGMGQGCRIWCEIGTGTKLGKIVKASVAGIGFAGNIAGWYTANLLAVSGTGAELTVHADGAGVVDSLTITAAGTGYTDGIFYGVPIPTDTGSGATADVTVSGGAVTAVTLRETGSDYAVGNTLNVPVEDTGTGAVLYFHLTSGTIDQIYGVLDGGSGYSGQFPLRIVPETGTLPAGGEGGWLIPQIRNGKIASVSLAGFGSGYNGGNAGTFEGVELSSADAGTGAKATVTTDSTGAITAISMPIDTETGLPYFCGSGYSIGPTSIVEGTGGMAAGGSGAVLIPTLTDDLIPAGQWQYCARLVWRDSNDAILGSGEPSDPSATYTTAEDSIITLGFTVEDWADAYDIPWVADGIEIYRRKMGDDGTWGAWYLLTTRELNTNEQEGYWQRSVEFGGVQDTNPTLDTLLPADAFRHIRPGPLAQVREWNGRLLGVDGESPSRVRFSTLGFPESWPQEIVDATSVTDELTWVGGSVQIGDDDVNNPIVGLVPEIGSYETTGVVGSAMLVFKHRDLYRWHGLNWSDFQVVSVAPVGCLAGKTVINTGGHIFWMGAKHLYAMEAGGFSPKIVSRQYWPTGIANSLAESHYWAAALLGDTVTLIGKIGSTYFSCQVNAETGAFVDFPQGSAAYTGLSVGPDSSGIDILRAGGTVSGYPAIYTFSNSVYAPSSSRASLSFKSRALAFGTVPEALAREKKIRRVWLAVTNKTGYTKQLTVSLYLDGKTTAAEAKAVSIPYVAAAPYQLVQVVFSPNIKCHTLNIGVTPTAVDGTLVESVTTPEFHLHFVHIDFDWTRAERAN